MKSFSEVPESSKISPEEQGFPQFYHQRGDFEIEVVLDSEISIHPRDDAGIERLAGECIQAGLTFHVRKDS